MAEASKSLQKTRENIEDEISKLQNKKDALEDKKEKLEEKKNQTIEELNETLSKADTNSVNQHNIVFRQMAAQLILVAGIFLALSTQFTKELSQSSTTVKILSLLIIILLNLSILLGILQHYMEAAFFKKIALGRREIRKGLDFEDLKSVSSTFGAFKQFEKMIGNSTKRWPTYLQMACLALAVVIIGIVSGLKLFGH